jgi:hypothetical protein
MNLLGFDPSPRGKAASTDETAAGPAPQPSLYEADLDVIEIWRHRVSNGDRQSKLRTSEAVWKRLETPIEALTAGREPIDRPSRLT